jgi:hypothetical protein
MSLRLASSRLQSLQSSTRRLTALNSHLTRPLLARTMVSQLPKTQEGVIIEKAGGTDVLQYKTDLPIPTLKEGEILVKNEYVGVNYIDTFVSLIRFPFALHKLMSRP